MKGKIRNKIRAIFIVMVFIGIGIYIYKIGIMNTQPYSEIGKNWSESWKYRIISTKYISKWNTLNAKTYSKQVPKDSSVILKNSLEKIEEKELSIAFYGENQEVKVYQDNELIYDYRDNKNTIGYARGSGWHIIKLNQTKQASTIQISIKGSKTWQIKSYSKIFLGNYSSIYLKILDRQFWPIVLCVIMFSFGILLIISSILGKAVSERSEAVFCLGVFAIFLAMWSLGQTKTLPLLFYNATFFKYFEFFSCMMTMISLCFYFKEIFRLEKIKKLFYHIGIVNAGLCSILFALNSLGVLLLENSIIYIYFSLSILGIFGFVSKLIEQIYDKKSWYSIPAIYLSGIIGLFIFELILCGLKIPTDYILSIRMFFFIFLVVQSYTAVEMLFTYYATVMKRNSLLNAAYIDPMTFMLNRRAYENRIAKIVDPIGRTKTAIVSLDINRLKETNDRFGHLAGDELIRDAAKVIRSAFREKESCYRVGGDEFICIVEGADGKKISACLNRLEREMKIVNKRRITEPVSIAYGYVIESPSTIGTVEEMIKEADHSMYLCKNSRRGDFCEE